MPVSELRQYRDSSSDPARTGEATKSEDIFRAYHGAQNDWATAALKNDSFFNGKQWRDDDITVLKNRGEAPVVFNVCRPAAETKVSILTASNPSWVATAREDTDNDMGQVFSMLHSYIWDQSSASAELKQVVHDYVHRGGRGVLYSYFDPNADFGKGEIIHRRLDGLRVYPDPNSNDIYWRDAKRVLTHALLTYEQAVDMWPDKKEIIERASTSDDDELPTNELGHYERDGTTASTQLTDSENQDEWSTRYRLLVRFERIREPFHRVLHKETGEERVFSGPEYQEFLAGTAFLLDESNEIKVFAMPGPDYDEVEAHYKALAEDSGLDPEARDQAVIFHLMEGEDGAPVPMVGPEHEEAIPGSTVIISPVPRSTLLEEGELIVADIQRPRIREHATLGGLELYDRVLPITQFPLTPFMNGFNSNPYPRDDIDDVRSIQENINFTQQKILSHLANSAGTVIIGPENFFKNKADAENKLSQPGTKYLEGNYDLLEQSGADLKVVQLGQLPGELYLKIERDKVMLEQIMGIDAASQGGPQPDRQPFRGALLQDEQMQRRLREDLDNIEGALTHHGRMVTEMIQHYYTKDKVIRLIQPSGTVESARVNQIQYDDFMDEIGKINDVTVGTYDVQVVGGSTLPNLRQAKSEYYERLYEKQMIPLSTALQKMEIANVERVIAEIGEIQQLTQQLQQAQEQMKDMDGLIQRQDNELRQMKRRVDSSKFQEQLAGTRARLERDQQVGSARIGDAVAMTKEKLALESKNGQSKESTTTN
jgi:hypothetical protein